MLHVMTPADYLLTVINFQMLLQKYKKKKKKFLLLKKKMNGNLKYNENNEEM